MGPRPITSNFRVDLRFQQHPQALATRDTDVPAIRRHDVNAKQVFYWRKLYREGRLGSSKQLLAVEVTKDRSAPVTEEVWLPQLSPFPYDVAPQEPSTGRLHQGCSGSRKQVGHGRVQQVIQRREVPQGSG
jgi:hypothetical protein